MTGELKVTRLRELALTKRIPFIWLLDSAGARIQEAVGSLFAGSGHLFREEVVMSGVIPQIAALMGPVRGRHRLHPRARRLRADGQGPRLDGARRAAPGARGGRRGRHPGGARRLARALPQVGRRRHGGRQRRGVHRADQAVPLLHAPELRAAAAAAAGRATRSTAREEELLDVLPGVQPQALRHVRGDPPDRRRRRVLRHQGRSGRRRSSPASRASAGARRGSSPTSPSSSAGSSTTTPPTRPRASSTSATPSGSRSCS